MAATHLDELAEQVLALPDEDRAKLATLLAKHQGNVAAVARALKVGGHGERVPRLLDLAGTGRGLWGDNSTEYLQRLRAEWP